jgi:hypothetical protein
LDGVAYAQVNLLDDKVWDRVAEIVTDPTERAFVLLMLDGERSRETYADVLGIPEDTKSTPRPGDPDGTDTGWTQVEGRAVG